MPEPTSSSQPRPRCRAFSLRVAAQELGLNVPSMWQNRLDFRHIVRIAVCVGRRTWQPDDAIRARLAVCGALGSASVIPTPRSNGAQRHVDTFRQEVFEPQERRAEEDERQIESGASAQGCTYCDRCRSPAGIGFRRAISRRWRWTG